MAMPLKSSTKKLIVVIQCVTRTVTEWGGESDTLTCRTSTARTCADSAILDWLLIHFDVWNPCSTGLYSRSCL
jgi:hypothetical protein